MIRNYIKIAFRNLKKDLLFSFINIFGLMTGLAAFILIALYVFDEYTYDSFHDRADSIYRIVDNVSVDGKQTRIAGAGYQISEKLEKDLPEIQGAARLAALGRINVSNPSNTNVFYEDYTIGNNDFLKIFNFKVLEGDRETALSDPSTVIITEETAEKFFGTTEVVGKSLNVGPEGQPFRITAVLENFPANSHISFNLLMSEASVINKEVEMQLQNDWTSDNFRTYLLLDESTNIASLEGKINSAVAANTANNTEVKNLYQLQPLKDIHFHSNDIEGDSGKKGNIYYLYVFSFIAIFVLLIACINYVNLTTARSTNRAKEIAMRKVVGASKKSLITQFLSEAYIFTLVSLLLALILVRLILPSFNEFTGKALELSLTTDYRIPLGILLVILCVGLFSGLYPALFLSSLKPLLLLKSKIKTGKGNLSLRRMLVIFQFSLSIIMLFATIVVYLQMEFVDNKDMGFAKEQLVVVDINSGKIRNDAESIKAEFLAMAQVKDVAVSSRVPGEWKNLPKVRVKNSHIQTPAGNEMYFLGVDHRFLDTYGITLINGRNFNSKSVADSSSVLINETAAKELGITEASEQLIKISQENPFMVKVIGIVRDFNFQSLREPLAPMVLGFEKNPVQAIDYFTVKVVPNDVSTTLDAMDNVLQRVDPNHLFEYHYLDEQWELLYKEDKIRKTIFLIIAILTIIIACLGLLGLVTFEAKQRIKEIGIRKVSGASVGNIVVLLSQDLLKLVFVAALLAFPVAWYIMDQWLEDFAYRIDIHWWVFALAGLSAVLIALFTMSFQATKAALANPAKTLKTE